MAMVSGVRTGVSKREKLQQTEDSLNRRKFGRIFDTIGKYAVDFAVNFSSKADIGWGRLHKTVQEDIKEQGLLKPCTTSEKPVAIFRENEMQTKIEEMQEMSTVKHATGLYSEKMEPMSLNKLPPEQLKEKDSPLPTKKRIMIRSRL